MNKNKEIECLIKDVERKMGKKLVSPNDFKELIDCISKKSSQNETLGITTIKRLWGYVENEHKYRFYTVSVLARFIGYKDWADYCENLRMQGNTDSDFLTDRQIKSEDLHEGDLIEIGWIPDRRCVLCYLGNDTFRVESEENSKLSAGDTFKAVLFCLDSPLYVSSLNCSRGNGLSYVAGKNHGLTLLERL
ncbi:MAG: hypothetical protein Q4D41_02630 [Prevotellaceae bacterium]|nr:hypothetical protein [Prevotellaceae bacterium]